MKFLAEADNLTVTFEGWEVVWSLKRKLVIPRSQIVDLQWLPETTLAGRLWRIGGADLPRLLWAGRFIGGGKRYFLYLLRPQGLSWARGALQLQHTLSITLQDNFYQQVLLTCDPDTGASLMNWFEIGHN